MNDNHHITSKLDELRPTLSRSECSLLWQNIAPHIGAAVPSPYTKMLGKKGVVAVMMVLVTLTASGTVAAAQPARPGDVLFPVDQVSERALLLLTPEARREALKERFMEERFYELESLFDEAVVSGDDGVLAWNSDDELEVEADVFRDITVVKIELNDNTRYFTTSATTRESIAEATAARYNLPFAAVLSVLEYSVEDRDSRPRDRGVLAPEKQGDIASAIAVVLDQMDDHDDDRREAFVSRFMEEYDSLTPFVNDDRINRYRERDDDRDDDDDEEYEVRAGEDRIKIDDDRIEIRSDGLRIRYDDDGTVEIKEDDDRDDDDSDSRGDDNSDTDDSRDDEEGSKDDSDSRNDDDREEDDKDEGSSEEEDDEKDNDDDRDDDNDDDDNR